MGWLISGIIAAVLAGLLSCKVRVSLSCHETVTCRVTLAGIRIFSIPAPEKKRRKQERTEEKPEGGQKQKFQPDIQALLKKSGQLLRFLRDAAGLLYRKLLLRLVVNRLELRWTVARGDAYQTAMAYGKVSAGIYNGLALLEQLLTVRDREISIQADFQRGQDELHVDCSLYARVFDLLACAAGLLILILKQKELLQIFKKGGVRVEK